MTKIILISTALTVLTLTSCKKNRACGCGSKQVPQFEALDNYRDTKKEATKKCEELETHMRQGIPDVECELV